MSFRVTIFFFREVHLLCSPQLKWLWFLFT